MDGFFSRWKNSFSKFFFGTTVESSDLQVLHSPTPFQPHETSPEVTHKDEGTKQSPPDHKSSDLKVSPPKPTSPPMLGTTVESSDLQVLPSPTPFQPHETSPEVTHKAEGTKPSPPDHKSSDLKVSPPNPTSPPMLGKSRKQSLLVDIYARTTPSNIVDEKLMLSNQEVGIMIDFSRYKMKWKNEDEDEARWVVGCQGDDDWEKSISASSREIKKRKSSSRLASQEIGKKRRSTEDDLRD